MTGFSVVSVISLSVSSVGSFVLVYSLVSSCSLVAISGGALEI